MVLPQDPSTDWTGQVHNDHRSGAVEVQPRGLGQRAGLVLGVRLERGLSLGEDRQARAASHLHQHFSTRVPART